MSHYNLITILGPTASGKTQIGAELAYRFNGEIISGDSRQVYRGMNLGTGKDYEDYVVQDKKIPCHLIDIHNPGYRYNVYEYQRDFHKAFREIVSRGKLPVLVGGTGLYIQAVLDKYQLIQVPVNPSLREELAELTQAELVCRLKRYDIRLHNTSDLLNRKRTIRAIEIADYYQQNSPVSIEFPEIVPFILGVRYERTARRKKITERLHKRLKEGLVEEVEELMKTVSRDDLLFYGLEYKMVTLYLIGELTYNEMIEKLEIAIHQFAKRQMTWFRRMEKSGFFIHWIDGEWSLGKKLDHIYSLIYEEDRQLINQWKK
jgi:tRNA dimethylallyltransferase